MLRRIDGASLALFRILFGTLLCVGCVRFIQAGWVDVLYAEPTFFFKYQGFEWVEPWPAWGMHVHYWTLTVLAAFVAVGFVYRLSAALLFVGFTYVELIDVTNYLNHYYLVSLLALLMCFLPLHRMWSIDAWLRPRTRRATQPAWCLYLLRFQYAVVYFYAGLAKVSSDWLLGGQPLGIWMAARDELPVIGPWLAERWIAFGMSWAGCVYDLTVVGFLLWRRTRPFAFLVLLCFHGLTWVFFDIGLFPFIMSIGGLLFFSPGWPRRFLRSAAPAAEPAARPAASRLRAGLAVALVYCAFQVLFPLRHYAYPGDVVWNEEGMRWSWKVMLREKNGAITYRVRSREQPREWQVSPHRYLAWRQVAEMSGQPDLILQLAHHIADDYRGQGHTRVEVRVDAKVSLNGRPSQRMIDPAVDLARVEDRVWPPATWILPQPAGPPLRPGGAARSAIARGATR